jgi:hypothetical protein
MARKGAHLLQSGCFEASCFEAIDFYFNLTAASRRAMPTRLYSLPALPG